MSNILTGEIPSVMDIFPPPSTKDLLVALLMRPWPGALVWTLIWACHFTVLYIALGPKVLLSDKLHCLGFSHSIVVLPAAVFFVLIREPLEMNMPPTLNHYLIINITAGYMIVDALGFLVHCLRTRRSMFIYFTHHIGSLIGIAGAYVTGTFATEAIVTLFLLMLHAPLYYASRYMRSLGMEERADFFKQVSADIDALVAFLYGPPVLVYVARADCHIFFKACAVFLAFSNYLWVFLTQYRRLTKSKGVRGLLAVRAGCSAKLEVTPVGDVMMLKGQGGSSSSSSSTSSGNGQEGSASEAEKREKQ